MKLVVSNPKRHSGERGFLVIALLALISIMLIYIAANLHVLAALKRDVRIVEQKQIRHWEKTFPPVIVSTNTVLVGPSPVEVAK